MPDLAMSAMAHTLPVVSLMEGAVGTPPVRAVSVRAVGSVSGQTAPRMALRLTFPPDTVGADRRIQHQALADANGRHGVNTSDLIKPAFALVELTLTDRRGNRFTTPTRLPGLRHWLPRMGR